MAENGDFASYFIKNDMFRSVIKLIQERPLDDLSREGIWWICNSITWCDESSIVYLINQDIIIFVIDTLNNWTNNTRMTKILLIIIDKILKTKDKFGENDEKHPIYQFEINGGIEALGRFADMQNVEIFNLSQNILKYHFPEGEEVTQDIEKEPEYESEDVSIEF